MSAEHQQPMGDSDVESTEFTTKKRSRIARALGDLIDRAAGKLIDREQSRERVARHAFPVNINGEVQIADLEIAEKGGMCVDSALIYPLSQGIVTVITRPGIRNDFITTQPVSHVSQLGLDGDWVSHVVSKGQATQKPSPIHSLSNSQNPDEKGNGQFAKISLQEGSEVLVTRRADIDEIEAITAALAPDSDTVKQQNKYQQILDLVTAAKARAIE